MFKTSEFSLVLLHVISALHDRLLHLPGSSLVLTMLGQTALREEVARRHSQPNRNSIFRSPEIAAAAADAPPPPPLLFSAAAKDSPLLMRWSDSWNDAVCSSAPTRVLFLPSLFAFLKDCSLQKAEEHVSAMLGEIGATLWPPTSWEAQLEHKDQIYAQFNGFMLPARWANVVGGDTDKLAATLLDFCRVRGDGKYFVKGSVSCAKQCGKSIDVIGGKCSELAGVLRCWTDKMHQHCAGIQPFMPGFDAFELRTWLVPDQLTGRWRSGLTIRTQYMPNGHEVSSELSQPLHGKGLRVAALIDEMLEQQAVFFEALRQKGVPALRIDCGWDEANQRAFFSEFAVCEAWMWTSTHGQDLAAVMGRGLGDGVWKQLHLDA